MYDCITAKRIGIDLAQTILFLISSYILELKKRFEYDVNHVFLNDHLSFLRHFQRYCVVFCLFVLH